MVDEIVERTLVPGSEVLRSVALPFDGLEHLVRIEPLLCAGFGEWASTPATEIEAVVEEDAGGSWLCDSEISERDFG